MIRHLFISRDIMGIGIFVSAPLGIREWLFFRSFCQFPSSRISRNRLTVKREE